MKQPTKKNVSCASSFFKKIKNDESNNKKRLKTINYFQSF